MRGGLINLRCAKRDRSLPRAKFCFVARRGRAKWPKGHEPLRNDATEQKLARGADFEHLRSAFRALAFRCGAAVLHGDLYGVFDLALRLALYAIGFCCHLRILRRAGRVAAGRIRVCERASLVSTRKGFLLAPHEGLREGTSVDGARYLEHAAFEQLRGDRGFAWQGPGLWTVGVLDGLRLPSVAIVGTRAASAYGRRLARSFARELGAHGCCIVSGLALGIDAAAHEGALEAGAPTIGVLGGGHARFFPERNRELGHRMAFVGGAVLSLWPPEHSAFPHQFLERNAVVAALADAVLVIEAPARSGALNTANWAAPRIPVLAVPGDVDRRHVEGCHALIRDGAILARSTADVLEVLDLTASRRERILPARDGLAGTILTALAEGECDLDHLADVAGAGTADILAALALLEFEGLVERRGSRYAAAL